MSFLTWKTKKKLIPFLIVAGTFASIAFIIVFLSIPKPTCDDGKQNQGEEGIDCGLPCTPCVVNPKDVITLWTRALKIGDGLYEVASLVENPNLFYGMPLLKYTFKLYDSMNILVAVREGQTHLNPSDTFMLFVTQINTGERQVARAYMEVEYLSPWKYIDTELPPLIVSQKSFSRVPLPPTLSAKLSNESLFPVRNVGASAVLYNENGQAIAVSSTIVDIVKGESSRDITFTWPYSFEETPASSKIYIRKDYLSNGT